MKKSTLKITLARTGILMLVMLVAALQVNAQNWITYDGSYVPSTTSTPVPFAVGDSWNQDNVPMTTDGDILKISSPVNNTTKGNQKFSTKRDTLTSGTWMFRTRMVYTTGVRQRSEDIEFDCGVGQRAQFTLKYDSITGGEFHSWWSFGDASATEIKSAYDYDVQNFHTYRVTTSDGIVYNLYIDENPVPAAVLTSGKASSSKPRLFFKFGDNYSTASFTEGELDWIAGDTTGCYGPKALLPAGVIVDGTPLYPLQLAAGNVTQNAFSLSWDASAIAKGYKLQVATDTAFSSIVTGYDQKDLGDVLTFDVTDLTPNTPYYARVEAYNDTTLGAFSPYIMVITSPMPPEALAASAINEAGFDANWNATEGATGYKLDVATDTNFTSLVDGYSGLDIANALTYTVTGLNPTTPYFYRVMAYSDSWTTAYSNVIKVTTADIPVVAPAAPVATDATAIKQTEFVAHWNPSESASGYYLIVATDEAFINRLTGYDTLEVNGTTKLVNGLTSSTAYYYKVLAFNSAGYSGPSNIIMVTTLIDPPAAPVATDGTDISYTSFTANWNASATATGYKLDVATDDAFTSMVAGYDGLDVNDVTTYGITGLNSKANYYYRVRAYNDGGNSANSNAIMVSTLDNAVNNLAASRLVISQGYNYLKVESSSAIEKVLIFDITGKLLLNRSVNGTMAEINTLGLHNGIYLVNVQAGGKNQVRKISIVR